MRTGDTKIVVFTLASGESVPAEVEDDLVGLSFRPVSRAPDPGELPRSVQEALARLQPLADAVLDLVAHDDGAGLAHRLRPVALAQVIDRRLGAVDQDHAQQVEELPPDRQAKLALRLGPDQAQERKDAQHADQGPRQELVGDPHQPVARAIGEDDTAQHAPRPGADRQPAGRDLARLDRGEAGGLGGGPRQRRSLRRGQGNHALPLSGGSSDRG